MAAEEAESTRAPRRWSLAAVAPGVVALWLIAGRLLPSGLPLGVVGLGVVLGALNSLTALGLVLIYRSSRIINFAQAEIGALAASVAVVMVAGWGVPYVIAVPIGLGVAVGSGALIDATVVRRFFTAPRLILTVATVGVAQILGAMEVSLPQAFVHLRQLTTFSAPFTADIHVGPLVFTADYVLTILAVPALLAGLAWFLNRSDTGIAVRATADSSERAQLLGIPVRRLSRVTWMVAAGLSGVASVLSAGVLGPHLGVVAGPTVLLPPLAAAVIAGMESLSVAVVASLAIGVFQQAVFWSYPRSSTVDVAVFFAILVALLARRRRFRRVDDSGLGEYVAIREVRPLPAVLRHLPEVRWARIGLWVAVGLATVVVPLGLSHSRVTLASYMAIYGIIAVSMVVLSGWSGQISLGQFAFVGVGAATTAALLVHGRVDLLIALPAAAIVGAATAVAVGAPALRIQGLFLAVTTLAFAVPVSTFLLNSTYFPLLTPEQVQRPPLIDRFDLNTPRTFYFVCLACLALALVLARNFRRSRTGRAVLAVRDNGRAAASYGISPVRAKLTAFAFSGGLAGFAGGLYVVGLRGIGFSGFDPVASLQVFTMVVVGGLGSLPGALLGAIYVEGAQYYLHGGAQLLATGAGLLLLLLIVPGGLGEVALGARDLFLRRVARRRELAVPSFEEHTPALFGREDVPGNMTAASDLSGVLRCREVDASYGHVQVLFGVNLDVAQGEVVCLVGTNGAGKSTALRVIAGLLPADRGQVVLDGDDISGWTPGRRVQAGLVTVPGGRGVFASLTVAENLRLACWLYRRDTGTVVAETSKVLDLFPALATRLRERAAVLSGGEQQMLTLAQAMLCRPRVLMIDELSLGLAPTVVADLVEVVARLNQEGMTILVVEQSVNLATRIAERAVFMERGQVRFTGPTADLMDRPDLLRAVFLAPSPARSRRRAAAAVAKDEPARLQVTGMRKTYGGVVAIDNVDLSVGPGRILGIIGSNGAGKTTLFDLCSGFAVPDSGSLLLDGRDVTGLNAAGRARLGLGRSFQDARLFPSMTVAEVLATALDRHLDVREPLACIFRVGAVVDSERAAAERVDELLEASSLVRYRDAFISELSTGTRRIVELACASAHGSSVLMLDEPSSGIAQRESEALAGVLVELRDRTGASLAIVEHDVPLIASIADELVCLHLGSVIAAGPPADVLAHPAVIESYLGTNDATIQRSDTARRGRTRRSALKTRS